MAKKQKQLYKLSFDGAVSEEYETKVQSMGRGNGAASFFFSGAKSPAILIHTEIEWMGQLETSGKLEFIIDRSDAERRFLSIQNADHTVGYQIELEAYYVIKGTEDKFFFELEQLPSGGWKLTHSLGLLPEGLGKARAFILEAI